MNHRLLTTWLAICALCFLAITGCASDLTPNPKAGDISTAIPLNLGFSRHPSYLPWFVAKQEDLFSTYHQNIDAKWFEDYGASVDALQSGLLDLNPQSAIDTIRSVSAGADLAIVMVSDRSMGNEKIIANDTIRTVADLKGKKVVLARGGAHELLLLLGLQKAQFSLDDVTIQILDAQAATEAFLTGNADAIGLSAPYTTRALARQGARELWSSANFPGLFFNTLSASRQAIEQYPQKVQGAIDVWFKTLDWMEENPLKTHEMMADRSQVSIDDFQGYELQTKRLSLDDNESYFRAQNTLDSFPVALETIGQLLLESGEINSKPDVSKLLEAKFVGTRSN